MLEREESMKVGHIRIDYTSFYDVDRWVEECHGLHEMVDEHERGKNINKIWLVIEDYEIDITNKLTNQEFSELQDYLSNI